MTSFATRDLWRIPGILSLSRVPLGALFALVSSEPPLAIGVLVLAAITDVADGWVARRFHEETPTGRVLDPITDKIFVATVVLSLIATRRLSAGEAVLLGMRELCEAPLVLLWMRQRRHPTRSVRGANHLGKLATVMQFIAIAAIVSGSPHRWWVLSTALCGLLAGVFYARRELRDRLRSASSP